MSYAQFFDAIKDVSQCADDREKQASFVQLMNKAEPMTNEQAFYFGYIAANDSGLTEADLKETIRQCRQQSL